MLFDSEDECDISNMLDDDEEDDEDDDDYVPGKRESDSDKEYGKRKRKSSRSSSSRYVPGKRNRMATCGGNRRNSNKSDDMNSDEIVDDADGDDNAVLDDEKKSSDPVVEDTISEKKIEKPVKKSPVKEKAAKKTPTKPKTTKSKSTTPRVRKPKKSFSEDSEDTPSSLRRSSRGSRTRAVSYADADISDEDLFEEQDMFEVFREIKEEKATIEKKKRVDDLWSKFKSDVSDTDKKPGEDLINEKKADDIKSESSTEHTDNNSTNSSAELKTENNNKNELENKPTDTSTDKVETITAQPTDIKVQSDCVKPNKSDSEIDNSNDKHLDTDKQSHIQTPGVEEKLTAPRTEATSTKEKSNATEVETSSSPGHKPLQNTQPKLTESAPLEGNTRSPLPLEKKNEQINPREESGKSSSNGNDQVVKKPESLLDHKPVESHSLNTYIKRDVVVVEEKDLRGAAGSSSSLSKDQITAQDLQKSQDFPKSQGDSFLIKPNPNRSAGISNFLSSGVKKTGGLTSVLNTIEKKKKMSVLDKTKCDWDNYKSEADIEDELRGNRHSGYLDRQEFLQRVDYNQWENEREMRLYTNRK